ncbi:MAG: bifunctional folylpolyglutamate synthase/dihydrofolate synthase [Terrimicrobiaceae bacterium]|nr:bifunctional folylpolyglutamate synthase/dihydrofolate synthase [Terrimicrobiaceae bacterium]
MNYPEALAWLYSTQQFGIKLGLENTRRLLAILGNPERECRFLHVAGTNGKGSVCAMLDAVLRAAGHRTGLYTSPHLADFRERIRVDGEWIPEADVARFLTGLREAVRDWPHAPTYFELVTALAIRRFADAACDYVVLETGMGGRLDATNAVTPIVSVITPISMDHAQWLGDTLEKIAGEKAGILKPGVPAVSAPQADEVRRVLIAHAPVAFIDGSLAQDIPINLRGSHQRRNAALALAALDAAEIEVSDAAMRTGLATVDWPGRFQEVGRFVLDGAHNTHGCAQLVQTWREIFGDEKATVIFGALRDKTCAEMIAALAPLAESFWFVPVASARSETPKNLAATADGRVFMTLADAVREAGRQEGRVLVTGSLFLVGEALGILASIKPRAGA